MYFFYLIRCRGEIMFQPFYYYSIVFLLSMCLKIINVVFDQVTFLIIIHFLSVLMDKCEGHLLIKSSENIVTRRSLSCVFFLLIDGILFICPYSIDPFRTKIKSNKTDKGNYFFYVIYSQTTVTKNLCKNL